MIDGKAEGTAMTEAEWLAITDPNAALELLKGTASDRKLCLALIGYTRRWWAYLTDSVLRKAVEASEKYVDGSLARAELLSVEDKAVEAIRIINQGDLQQDCNRISHAADVAWTAIYAPCAEKGIYTATLERAYVDQIFYPEDGSIFSTILRDIFGNPFCSVLVETSWRTSTVLALANRMYDSRDFTLMPILADALQDAGCENAGILSHCRGDGPHVRGCWVVDLLLGKE